MHRDLLFLFVLAVIAPAQDGEATPPFGRQVSATGIKHSFLGLQFGFGGYLLAQTVAGHMNGHLNQVTDNLFDVAPDVTNFGELGRLDLNERCLGELRQAPGDFCFADAGRAHH